MMYLADSQPNPLYVSSSSQRVLDSGYNQLRIMIADFYSKWYSMRSRGSKYRLFFSSWLFVKAQTAFYMYQVNVVLQAKLRGSTRQRHSLMVSTSNTQYWSSPMLFVYLNWPNRNLSLINFSERSKMAGSFCVVEYPIGLIKRLTDTAWVIILLLISFKNTFLPCSYASNTLLSLISGHSFLGSMFWIALLVVVIYVFSLCRSQFYNPIKVSCMYFLSRFCAFINYFQTCRNISLFLICSSQISSSIQLSFSSITSVSLANLDISDDTWVNFSASQSVLRLFYEPRSFGIYKSRFVTLDCQTFSTSLSLKYAERVFCLLSSLDSQRTVLSLAQTTFFFLEAMPSKDEVGNYRLLVVNSPGLSETCLDSLFPALSEVELRFCPLSISIGLCLEGFESRLDSLSHSDILLDLIPLIISVMFLSTWSSSQDWSDWSNGFINYYQRPPSRCD